MVENVYSGEGEPIEASAVEVYPVSGGRGKMQKTGVYVPPKQTPNLDMDQLTTRSAVGKTPGGGGSAPHLITGDFNAPSWEDLLEEWCGEEGMWKLPDPMVPTHKAGNNLNRAPFKTGVYAPETFLPAGETADHPKVDEGQSGIFFPAGAITEQAISDHFPAVIAAPRALARPTPNAQRLLVEKLAAEQWEEKNMILQEEQEKLGFLDGKRFQAETGRERGYRRNLDRRYHQLEQPLNRVLRGQFVAHRRPVSECPLKSFMARHAQHPDIDRLKQALQEGHRETADAFIGRMGADGWRAFLSPVGRTDTRATFRHLAKAEGHRQV